MNVFIPIITAVAAIFASTGFWQYIIHKNEKSTADKKLLMGLAHDRLINQATKYIHRGYLTNEEYDDLYEYLYTPYLKNGGDGTVEKLMKEIEKLPMKTVSSMYDLKADLYGFKSKDEMEKFNKDMS